MAKRSAAMPAPGCAPGLGMPPLNAATISRTALEQCGELISNDRSASRSVPFDQLFQLYFELPQRGIPQHPACLTDVRDAVA